MDLSNTLTIKKSRIASVPVGATYERPGPEIVREISDYLSAGEMLFAVELADHAMTEGLTRPELQVIASRCRAGYDGAGVIDANGETVGLRDLMIGLCGTRRPRDEPHSSGPRVDHRVGPRPWFARPGSTPRTTRTSSSSTTPRCTPHRLAGEIYATGWDDGHRAGSIEARPIS